MIYQHMYSCDTWPAADTSKRLL